VTSTRYDVIGLTTNALHSFTWVRLACAHASQKFLFFAHSLAFAPGKNVRRVTDSEWRKVLKEATGEDISTRAMMDYFKPLMSWLEEQNKGRQIGWD
jgi:hypothetical protein